MPREFTVRVPEVLAGWVRARPLSHTVLLGRIAQAVDQGQIPLALHDPGPGPERLTVRPPAQALPWLKTVAHARENCTAVRKLFASGFQARALPMRSTMALPRKRLGVGARADSLSLPEPAPEVAEASSGLLAGFFAGECLAEDIAIGPAAEPEFAAGENAGVSKLQVFAPRSPDPGFFERIPFWVMALGVGIGLLFLLWLFRRQAAPVVAKVAALPQKAVRAWLPSVPSKLAGGVWF